MDSGDCGGAGCRDMNSDDGSRAKPARRWGMYVVAPLFLIGINSFAIAISYPLYGFLGFSLDTGPGLIWQANGKYAIWAHLVISLGTLPLTVAVIRARR